MFSDEKFFDIDGVHNSQDECVWIANYVYVDEKGGIMRKQNFTEKVMVWSGACSMSLMPLLSWDERTVDHSCRIKHILPAALKYGNEVFSDKWILQQDDRNLHRDNLTQR